MFEFSPLIPTKLGGSEFEFQQKCTYLNSQALAYQESTAFVWKTEYLFALQVYQFNFRISLLHTLLSWVAIPAQSDCPTFPWTEIQWPLSPV